MICLKQSTVNTCQGVVGAAKASLRLAPERGQTYEVMTARSVAKLKVDSQLKLNESPLLSNLLCPENRSKGIGAEAKRGCGKEEGLVMAGAEEREGEKQARGRETHVTTGATDCSPW